MTPTCKYAPHTPTHLYVYLCTHIYANMKNLATIDFTFIIISTFLFLFFKEYSVCFGDLEI